MESKLFASKITASFVKKVRMREVKLLLYIYGEWELAPPLLNLR